MRSFPIILCLLFLTGPASAQLLLYEGFDYTEGDEINGKVNPFTNQTWSKPPTPTGNSATALIDAPGLAVPGLASSVGNSLGLPRLTQSNISRITVPGGPYNPTTATNDLFFSFAMQMTDWVTVSDETAASSTHRDGDFLAGFTASGPAGGMSGANVYAGQFRIRRELDESNVQTGKYQLGFHKNNLSGGTAYIEWDTSRSFEVGETVFIVGEYQFGTTDVFDDVVRMWINPTPGAAAGTATIEVTDGYDVSTAGGAAQGNINSFWFRDGNSFLPGPTLVDELRIGTTYESVTPAAAPGGLVGDYNGDNVVNAADYAVWRDSVGADGSVLANRDPSNSGVVGNDDYNSWAANFGDTAAGSGSVAVPEPAAIALLMVAVAVVSLYLRQKS